MDSKTLNFTLLTSCVGQPSSVLKCLGCATSFKKPFPTCALSLAPQASGTGFKSLPADASPKSPLWCRYFYTGYCWIHVGLITLTPWPFIHILMLLVTLRDGFLGKKFWEVRSSSVILDGGKGCLQEASIFFAALMAFQLQVFHSFPQCWPSLIRFLLFAREFQHRRASIPWNWFSSPFQPAQNLWKDWSPSLLSCTAKAMLSKMPMRRWEEFKNWQQRFVIDATQGQLL